MQQKLVVVTGATGYLGSRIFKRLLQNNYEVQAIVRPESNLALFKNKPLIWNPHLSPSDRPVYAMIHCATEYGRDEVGKKRVFETNFEFACQVFEWGKRSGMKTFINAGTSLAPEVSPYALSKAEFQKHLAGDKSQNTIHLALEHFFGPGDSTKKFVTWLIHELLSDRKRIPLTAGAQMRDFIYIDDVVEAFEQALLLDSVGQYREWHVRAPKEISLRHLAEFICELCGKKLETLGFGDLAYRENEPMSVLSKLPPFTQTGWKARVNMQDGLKTTVSEEVERRNKGNS